MEFIHLTLNELQDLMKKERDNPYRPKNNYQIKCISSTDLFYEIEQLRKNLLGISKLNAVKENTCNLYAARDSGYVQIIDLDSYYLENGLFEVGEDYYTCDIWQPAINSSISPTQSATIVSLRAFDNFFGSNLYETYISAHS